MSIKAVLTWGKRLLQLVCLLSIKDAEGVQVLGAAHLELDGVLGPLDPHQPRVLPPRRQQEVLDLVDLLRLPMKQKRNTNESAVCAIRRRSSGRPTVSVWRGRRGERNLTMVVARAEDAAMRTRR